MQVDTVQSIGPTNAKVMLVGDFPSEQDIQRGEPFVGGGGFELTKCLNEAGLSRNSCFLSLVIRKRVAGNRIESIVPDAIKRRTADHVLHNGKFVHRDFIEGAEELRQEILRLKPNVVCALGNLALFALTGEWGVDNWRSSIMESTLVPGLKVIPTFSPARLAQNWATRPLLVHDLKRVARQSQFSEIVRPKYDFIIRPNYETASTYLDNLLKEAHEHLETTGKPLDLAGDIETRAGHIACLALARSSTESICIPFMCQHDAEGYWTPEEEASLVHKVYRICRVANIIGQNWNYDAQYFWRWWHFICPRVEDTMVMHHSCFSAMPKNLAFLSSMYLEDHLYWKDDRTNWTTGPTGEGEDTYWIYNCTDAVRTFAIAQVLRQVVAAMGMESVNAFQQKLQLPVLKTMNRGIRLDYAARARYSAELQRMAESRIRLLEYFVGHPVNVNSPKQMADLFYRELGQTVVKSKKSGSPTCDDEALQKIASREPLLKPLTQAITEIRSALKFDSTFVMAEPDTDGRARTSFNTCGTETYRFSSSTNAFGTGSNFQNISKGSKETEGEHDPDAFRLPNVRKMYIPDPGKSFFDIDLDSADLRIVTFESDCQWMKEHFKAGRKPYVEVMKEYYRDQSITKHHKSYGMFKSLCHGTNYLGEARGLSSRIGLLVHEVERIQKWYYGLCPEIKAWQDRIKKQVEKQRFVSNAFGYKMFFFDKIEGTIFNQAVAWIPQSTVGCLINRAYVNIEENLPEVEVLLQVHDSLAGQVPTENKQYWLQQILKQSEIVIPYDDPLVIPVGIVSSEKSWGDCD